MLKRNIIVGIEINEKIKLDNMNWLTITRFPPHRSAKRGTAVNGGTALCKNIISAML